MLRAATQELEVTVIYDVAGLGWPDITIILDSCGMRAVGRRPAVLRDDTE